MAKYVVCKLIAFTDSRFDSDHAEMREKMALESVHTALSHFHESGRFWSQKSNGHEWWGQLLYKNVQWSRGGLVSKAHRDSFHSTLGSRTIQKEVGSDYTALSHFRGSGRF